MITVRAAPTGNAFSEAGLASELECAQRFRAVLMAEQAAVEAADISQLPQLAAQKATLQAAMVAAARLREADMKRAGLKPDWNGLQAYLATFPALSSPRRTLIKLLQEYAALRNLNLGIGRLMEHQVAYLRSRQSGLIHAAGRDAGYNMAGTALPYKPAPTARAYA
jgi:flagellar biosynthesis/type III secretory pathway chaperone